MMTEKEKDRRTKIIYASQEPFDWKGTRVMVLDGICFYEVDRGYGRMEWRHNQKNLMNDELLAYLRENSYTI